MTISSLFVNPLFRVFDNGTSDFEKTHVLSSLVGSETLEFNVEEWRRMNGQVTQSQGFFPTVDYPLSGWLSLIVRVKGSAKVITQGYDTDGVTGISSEMHAIGTEQYPGWVIISTEKLWNIQVYAEDNPCWVDLFLGKVV